MYDDISKAVSALSETLLLNRIFKHGPTQMQSVSFILIQLFVYVCVCVLLLLPGLILWETENIFFGTLDLSFEPICLPLHEENVSDIRQFNAYISHSLQCNMNT